MKHTDIINEMTLEEKAGMCSGLDYWHTKPITRLGIPSIMVSDGPHGLRRHPGEVKKTKGSPKPLPAVCFPLACLSACSWDINLIKEMGAAIGEEALAQNVSVVLGPGVNIKRSPLCGRNFEYFSEDPYVAGEIGAAWVDGVQSKGVGTSLKHFACNSQESYRMTSNSVVDERALREIYLMAFERVIKKSHPWTIMSAYNKLNGTYCTENEWLLNKVLRKEWGFDGIVVCDWGAENIRAEGIKAGNDLEMPASNGIGEKSVIRAVQNGELEESVLDECVDRMIELTCKASNKLNRKYNFNRENHHQLARKIAGQSMVLLKNDENILPIKVNSRIAIIGEMAKKPRYQGAGSSQVNPTKVDNFYDIAKEANLDMAYAAGYDLSSDKPNWELIKKAAQVAKKANVVIIFAGLPEHYEAEALDRESIKLPESHNMLIKEICRNNPNVVVVLSGGAPVAMPWINEIKGLLNAELSGQAGAGAILDILTGKVNPSGKLVETYPLSDNDVPCSEIYADRYAPVYKESIYVGYRYYDSAKKEVLFPFGYGLSYTAFEYSDLHLSSNRINDNDTLQVQFKIKNIGKVYGAEVVQIYVSDKESTIFRPEKELRGFKKVFLNPEEEQIVSVELSRRDFAFYNISINDWTVESGDFDIIIAASSRDIKLVDTVNIKAVREDEICDYRDTAPDYYSCDVKSVSEKQFEAIYGNTFSSQVNCWGKPLDLNSTFSDGKDTPSVKALKKIITKLVMKAAPNETQGRVAVNSVMNVPLRVIISMSQGVVSENMAKEIIDILEGKGVAKPVFKILKELTKTIKNLSKLLSTVS